MAQLFRLWIFNRSVYIVSLASLGCFACRDKPESQISHSLPVDKVIHEATGLLRGEAPKRSISYLDSVYSTSQGLTTADLWEKYNFKAYYYQNFEYSPVLLQNFVDSMYSVISGKHILYKDQYVQTIFADADALMSRKRYSDAFERYYRALAFARKNLNSCQYSSFTYRLAMVRYRQQEYNEANELFHDFLSESRECGSGFREKIFLPFNALNAIGLCFEKAGKLDSASLYYHRTLKFLNSRKNNIPLEEPTFLKRAEGVVYGNVGGLYSKRGQPELAERYLTKSIALNNRPGFEVADAVTAEIKLVELYIKTSRFSKADSALSDLKLGIGNLRSMKRDVQGLLISYYGLGWILADSLGQTEKAYQMLKQHAYMQDSVYNASVLHRSKDMDAAFQLSEQQHKLELLAKDNRIKQQVLLMIIGFSAMFITILVIVWINLKRSSRQVQELKRLNLLAVEQNDQMRESLEALEQSQIENTRLLRVVAHDLRSPLAGIYSLTSMLLEGGFSSEEQKEMLETVKVGSQDSLNLVKDLLNTRPKKGNIPLARVDLSKIIHDCANLLYTKAQNKDQQMRVNASTLIAMVNREKIWRVISNLLANAIKFSPTGSSIAVVLTRNDQSARISVEDQGIGIPEHMKESIFTMVAGSGTEGTNGEPSFGLGLAISKQIVDAHGGEIWFEERPGGGTIFFVDLPIY